MRSLLLPLLLLCVLCVARVQTQDQSQALRLCGRELLRAVVYTCGGSRWRRLTEDEDTLQEGSGEENELKTWKVLPARDRHQRNLNQALTTLCCQIGCLKSDLSRLC